MDLPMARGAGEVAPLMLVGAVKDAGVAGGRVFPYVHLERSFMHLGFHIMTWAFRAKTAKRQTMVFSTTLLLIAIIALLRFSPFLLRTRLRRRFDGEPSLAS